MAKEVLDAEKINLCWRKVKILKEDYHREVFSLLIDNPEMYVTEIAKKLGKFVSEISYYLKVMHKAGLLNKKRTQGFVYYSVNHKRLDSLNEIVEFLNKES